MNVTYEAALTEPDAKRVLAILMNESNLQLVSYGEYAVDLQLPETPSPHAVNLAASFAAGTLRLSFWMDEAKAQQQREWLLKRAQALGVELTLSVVPD